MTKQLSVKRKQQF